MVSDVGRGAQRRTFSLLVWEELDRRPGAKTVELAALRWFAPGASLPAIRYRGVAPASQNRYLSSQQSRQCAAVNLRVLPGIRPHYGSRRRQRVQAGVR